MLDIHKNIKDKLKYFYSIRKIPNIIFNGPSGSGKSTLVNDFIRMIYDNDNEKIKNLVMYVNCAHGKGIRFIRDDLKFFAETENTTKFFNAFSATGLANPLMIAYFYRLFLLGTADGSGHKVEF